MPRRSSRLSKIGDDYDTAAKEKNVLPGNTTAQYVYGPGTTKSVGQYTKEVAAADPANYVTSSAPPFVLFHGSADRLVSPSQTLDLSNALKAKGVDATRYVVEGANHGDGGKARACTRRAAGLACVCADQGAVLGFASSP